MASALTGGATWVGKSLRRAEDPRLLTGRAQFVDDIRLPNLHHAAILRSPYPHAILKGVDASRALAMPGVVSVFTGEDAAKLMRPFSVISDVKVAYRPIAVDKVRYVGEPVAVVVARSRYQAEDALDAIEVDYDVLPAVIDPEAALREDAPILHERSNLAVSRDLRYGEPGETFARAERTVSLRVVFPKYSSTPIETYGMIASYDPAGDQLTIWCNFHGPFIMHPIIADAIGMPENRIRFIVAKDVGGSFGIKISSYPYLALMGLVAKQAGVPVKWIEDRQEHLVASSSATNRVAYLDAAVNGEGRVLALRVKTIDDVGAYIRTPEPGCIFRSLGNFTGPYDIEHLALDARVVMTNKSMTGPNRGYGCQQLYFGLERLMDKIATEIGVDPAEVRRRNLIQGSQLPYVTVTGGEYDSGDYPEGLELALQEIDYDRLRRQQQSEQEDGKLTGLGIALAIDPSVSNMGYITVAIDPKIRAKPSYMPKSGSSDAATVKIDPTGRVTVVLGTAPHGQGHETVVAQMVADRLGVSPLDVVVIDEMDTATRDWSVSAGSYASRFAAMGLGAATRAADQLQRKLFRIAAHTLEVAEEDLELSAKGVGPKGDPDRAISIRRLAGIAHWNTDGLPVGMSSGLTESAIFDAYHASSPDQADRVNSSAAYGFVAEVARVEVDAETGVVKVTDLVSAHDAGRVVSPMIVEGQVQGSILHGLGGALYEEMAYDESGQYLTATFMDYLCPTASEAPNPVVLHSEHPSPNTMLGSKGCGESSSMTVPALIGNAVADALAPLGVEVTTLPLSPYRVWSLMQQARASR